MEHDYPDLQKLQSDVAGIQSDISEIKDMLRQLLDKKDTGESPVMKAARRYPAEKYKPTLEQQLLIAKSRGENLLAVIDKFNHEIRQEKKRRKLNRSDTTE
jgi:hypothetical protein